MRRLALVVVTGLALAACGSSSSTTGDAAAKAQIKSAYEKFFSGQSAVSDRVAVLHHVELDAVIHLDRGIGELA